jgi:hypothetical protein
MCLAYIGLRTVAFSTPVSPIVVSVTFCKYCKKIIETQSCGATVEYGGISTCRSLTTVLEHRHWMNREVMVVVWFRDDYRYRRQLEITVLLI